MLVCCTTARLQDCAIACAYVDVLPVQLVVQVCDLRVARVHDRFELHHLRMRHLQNSTGSADRMQRARKEMRSRSQQPMCGSGARGSA
jgi:hypothetical protein